MKRILVLSLTLLMVLYGEPITGLAQGDQERFSLPEGSVGQSYRANFAAVLRSSYGLRLQTESRASVFQWELVSGEIPPGLAVRPNGTVLGTPSIPRDAPYRFKVRVSDAAVHMSMPLDIEFELVINARQVRLVSVAGPKLVPYGMAERGVTQRPARKPGSINGPKRRQQFLSSPGFETVGTSDQVTNDARRFLGSERNESARTRDTPPKLATGAPTYEPSGYGPYADPIRDSFLKNKANGSLVDTNESASTYESNPSTNPAAAATCPGCTQTVCPACELPPGDEKRRLVIDARGGFKGERKFRKGETAQVVIINKNPYIKQYKTEVKETTVEETALKTFVPLLGQIISDAIGTTEDKSKDAKATDAQKSLAAADCPEPAEMAELDKEISDGMRAEVALRLAYKQLAEDHKKIVQKYETGVEALRNPRIQCAELYRASCSLRTDLEGAVDASQIESVHDKVEELEAQAIILRAKARQLKSKYPNCDSDFVNAALVTADGLLARVREATTNLKKITDDNATFEKTVKVINEVTNDERNFVEVHVIPKSRSTDTVAITLSAKNLKSLGGDPEDKSNEITNVEVQFGDAPYFAITGGIAVSTLEKTEFQRVQGFATDRQGNVIGSELTSIVGVKEDSSTRIAPLLMLHGRLYRPRVENIFSGIHWSLGITGKNDNKGTDIEYLVGPSLSFLNDQAFFTVGGYAGKRQSLEGNLFPGAEVPKDLAEIPVRKNYHWKLGFGLTYRIPLPK